MRTSLPSMGGSVRNRWRDRNGVGVTDGVSDGSAAGVGYTAWTGQHAGTGVSFVSVTEYLTSFSSMPVPEIISSGRLLGREPSVVMMLNLAGKSWISPSVCSASGI